MFLVQERSGSEDIYDNACVCVSSVFVATRLDDYVRIVNLGDLTWYFLASFMQTPQSRVCLHDITNRIEVLFSLLSCAVSH